MLKEYEYEAEVMKALLGQRRWRRGRRARWYERRAILLTRYLCFDEDGRRKDHVLWEAMRGVVDALKDEYTGIGECHHSLNIFAADDRLVICDSIPTKPCTPTRSTGKATQNSRTRAMCVRG
jgi:hypothetical protein